MTTTSTQNEPAVQATAGAAEKPEQRKKARVSAHKPHVAASQGQSGKKTKAAKKGARGKKATKSAKSPSGARQGSKSAKVLDLLQRSGGATTEELIKATGWQAHSVRGFISGTLGKKMGLQIESAKREDGARVYTLVK